MQKVSKTVKFQTTNSENGEKNMSADSLRCAVNEYLGESRRWWVCTKIRASKCYLI